jgi:DNA-binding CsgD family transcriptional regulator/tetratricopeptide (TPR) repeat protein
MDVVPLLERDTQLASLAEYASEAQQGDGRLVLIAGEAGVGKSALVEQLERGLPEAVWHWGACDGLFTPRPLGPLFDIASKLGGELLELCRADAPREELFGALLRQISAGGELHALVVEDIHWADEATIDLLRFLGRRIRSVPVLLLVTYRDDGLSAADPLRIALGDLATQACVRRIGLPPLSAGAVAALADGSGLDPAALYRLTGGNPFYVSQAMQAEMSEVPESARDAVLARAARLGRDSRAVLDVAALIGTRVELALFQAVAGSPPSAIDELLASGLLAGDGLRLQFRHEIARLAVASAVSAHRCSAIHARILAALQSRGSDDDAQMAFHAEAAGDSQAALRYASAAARRAAALASHREAAAQFERALRFADPADPATVAGLYDGFAYEVSLLDRWQEAARARRRALALWRDVGDRLREGDTLRWLASSLCSLSQGNAGIAAVQDAIALLEPMGPTAELAWAYATLASMWMMRGVSEDAIELARRAEAIAWPLGLTKVLSNALNTEACAVHVIGGEWAGPLRQSLDIALAGRHEAEVARAYVNLYACYVADRDWATAERYFTPGTAYCDDRDITTYSIFLRSERTSVLERTGHWDEAVALCRELLHQGGPSPSIRLCPLHRLGMIRSRRGEPGAWECLDEGIGYADGAGEPQSIVPLRLARAEAFWLEGTLTEARREAELADDVADGCDRWERGAVAVWLRRTGSARPPRGKLAAPYQLQLDGDRAGAARLWTDLGCPYEAALALLGSADEAALRKALWTFIDLGASATVRLTRQKMRRLAIRSIPAGPRTATRKHPLGLTRREREVLELICARHTNAEIAQKLFISVKTVDHHVSAVLAKLDAPTRRAAATRAAKLGLLKAASLAAEPPDHARLRPGQGGPAGAAGRRLAGHISPVSPAG